MNWSQILFIVNSLFLAADRIMYTILCGMLLKLKLLTATAIAGHSEENSLHTSIPASPKEFPSSVTEENPKQTVITYIIHKQTRKDIFLFVTIKLKKYLNNIRKTFRYTYVPIKVSDIWTTLRLITYLLEKLSENQKQKYVYHMHHYTGFLV